MRPGRLPNVEKPMVVMGMTMGMTMAKMTMMMIIDDDAKARLPYIAKPMQRW